MKNLIYIAVIALLASCSQPQNPNFETNVEIAKAWFADFETEDMDKVAAYFADELEYQGAFYGMPMMTTKDQVVQYMQGWHSAMDNIKYAAENYLPGVDPETSLPNGSVRTYGTWTGVSTTSGKSFEAKFYHYLTFDENGLIINGGDYGDAMGIMMAVAPDPAE
ncbi:MAG: Uncharacterised protein [Bacteroidota bacterium]|nr:MAG: Uncharacterised protein [Bacteroidota bacterium]